MGGFPAPNNVEYLDSVPHGSALAGQAAANLLFTLPEEHLAGSHLDVEVPQRCHLCSSDGTFPRACSVNHKAGCQTQRDMLNTRMTW